MSYIPTPPTDSLYKYIAITGIVLALVSIPGLSFLAYFNMHYERYQSGKPLSERSEQIIKQAECRKIELPLGTQKCLLSEINVDDSSGLSIEKLDELITQQTNQLEYHKNSIAVVEGLEEHIVWLSTSGIIYIFITVPLLSLILIMYGFWRWFKKIQKPKDELTLVELEIRKLERAKLEAELKNTLDGPKSPRRWRREK
jgi:hypothetical protein